MNKAKLKELINIETGSLNVQDSEKNGKYPFFSRKKEIYFLNEYTHDKEAIIVAGEGDFTPKYINGKFALHQRAYALSSTTELLSNKYLYYFIHTQKKILEKYSVGTTVQSLRKASFEELEIPLPPLHEQQKIASVLSVLDDQIELNNKINQALEDFAQTLYNYWFIQFEFPNEEGKPYKSSGGKMVWNEELKREIPEGWEVKKLKDSTMLNYGKNLPLKSIKGGCFSVYGANGIIGKHSQYTHENPCIIVGCRGSVGNVSRINEKCFITNNSISIESEDISYSFLFNYWKTQTFNKSITGSVQKQLTIENISKELMLLPSKSVEKKFSRKCDFLYNYIHQNEKQNQELAQLRDYLLPLLMNGQVTVSDELFQE